MLPSLAISDKFRRAGTETEEDRLKNDCRLITRNLEKLPRLSLANHPLVKNDSGFHDKLSIKKELQLLKNSSEKDYIKGLRSLIKRATPQELIPLSELCNSTSLEKQNAQTGRKNEVPKPFFSPKTQKNLKSTVSITRAGFKTKTFGHSKQNNLTSPIIKPNLNGVKGNFLFAVSEGHGPHGKEIVETVKAWLPNMIENNLNTNAEPENIKAGIESWANLTLEMLRDSNREVNFSACSLVTVLVLGETLYISNIGTCSAVLAKQDQTFLAHPLCLRHDLKNAHESRRVKASGARLVLDPKGFPVFSSGKSPFFEQTRCLGNLVGNSFGVSSTAEVFDFKLKNNDKFVIIASAGVWELISYQEAIDYCAEGYILKKTEVCCEAIIKECESRLCKSTRFSILDYLKHTVSESEESHFNSESRIFPWNPEKPPHLSLTNLPSMKMALVQPGKILIKKELKKLKDYSSNDYKAGLSSLMKKVILGKPLSLKNHSEPLKKPLATYQKIYSESQSKGKNPINYDKNYKYLNSKTKIITRAGFKTKTFGQSRQNNLTSIVIKPNLNGLKGNFLFSVCEGHGPNGKILNDTIKKEFPQMIETSIDVEAEPEDIKDCLQYVVKGSVEMLKIMNKEVNFSACSLICVLALVDSLYIANVGTCTAVLAKLKKDLLAVPLCPRHDLNNDAEVRRIKSCGASIGMNHHGLIVFSDGKGPVFEQTRCLGNLIGKSFGILATPEVFEIHLKKEDKFVIIGSAGLWELISYQEAADICLEGFIMRKTEICTEAVIKECESRLKTTSRFIHDVSVLVFFINT